jgi:hypothetical protein
MSCDEISRDAHAVLIWAEAQSVRAHDLTDYTITFRRHARYPVPFCHHPYTSLIQASIITAQVTRQGYQKSLEIGVWEERT